MIRRLLVATILSAILSLLFGVCTDRTLIPLTFSHEHGIASISKKLQANSLFTHDYFFEINLDSDTSSGGLRFGFEGVLLGPGLSEAADAKTAEVYYRLTEGTDGYGTVVHPFMAFLSTSMWRFVKTLLVGVGIVAVLEWIDRKK